MPSRALKACLVPGCSNTYEGKGGYCPIHKAVPAKLYNESGRDMERFAFEKSARWRKIRLLHLAKEPLCRRCKALGIIREAIPVHHIDDNWRNNLDTNLESLCNACHNKERAK